MRLEHISAVLRPRSEAEAVDLGLAMVRRDAAGIYRAWFTLLIPLWGGLAAVFHNNPGMVVLIAWWLKPLYGRVVLFYLGRALFGAAPTLREQLHEWPRLLRQRLGLSLLWGRLSGVRSFTLPVVVLEGLTGKLYLERTSILKRHGGGAAFGFMQLFLLLEMAVILGLWLGIRPYLPEEYLEWFPQSTAALMASSVPPPGLLWSLAICYLSAVALLEPFYAGGGFGLYINTRTHLEGWDVDLAFRQLGKRLRDRSSPGQGPPPLTLLVAFILCLGTAAPLRASAVDPVETKSQIQEVLTHPDFKEHVKKYREWVSGSPTPPPARPTPSAPEGWDWSWLTRLSDALTGFLSGDWKELIPRLMLALGLTALAAWLTLLIAKYHWARGPRRPAREKDRGPCTLMGLDVTPESLPPEIPTAAWALWQGGDPGAAVRLLYRGALSWLMQQGHLSIRESDTEGDCLRHAGALPEARRRQYFADLTGIWLATAYGQIPPGPGVMRDLCDRWPFALTEPSGPAPPSTRPRIVSLLLLLAVSLTGCKGKWEEREQEIGYEGQARRDPWLAATRFLELNNLPVLQQRGIPDLTDPTSVIIVTAETIRSEALARRLVTWTRSGGHLIYLAEGGESWRNDWENPPTGHPPRDVPHPLLTLLGVTQSEVPQGTTGLGSVTLDGEEFKVSLKEKVSFDLTGASEPIAFSAGNHPATALASLQTGEGMVTLVSHAHAFRNRWIDDDDHAGLLLALVDQTPVQQVIFIKAAALNLWGMLREHAWPALLALAVLVAAWLWGVLPRFGPVRALPRKAERRFAGHLEEAGTFLWHQKLTDSLLEAPRQAVLSASRRHGLREGERLFTDLLATRAGLPPERVQAALYGGGLAEAKPFTRQMADLQTLLESFAQRPPAS